MKKVFTFLFTLILIITSLGNPLNAAAKVFVCGACLVNVFIASSVAASIGVFTVALG